jgi:hypothetical protein
VRLARSPKLHAFLALVCSSNSPPLFPRKIVDFFAASGELGLPRKIRLDEFGRHTAVRKRRKDALS